MCNLGLHENQTETQRFKSFEKVQQHRHRDVVWQVGYQRGWSIWQFAHPERIVLHELEGLAGRALGNRGLEFACQLGVDLDGNNLLGYLEQPES